MSTSFNEKTNGSEDFPGKHLLNSPENTELTKKEKKDLFKKDLDDLRKMNISDVSCGLAPMCAPPWMQVKKQGFKLIYKKIKHRS